MAARNWGKKDIPNNRSSHHIPTSRMGGIGIVMPLFLGWYLLSEGAPPVGFMGWCLSFGLLGWWDDLKSLDPKLRLIIQGVLALGLSLYILNKRGADFLEAPFLAGGCLLLMAVWVVGFVNIFNFMDGVNLITGLTTLIASVFFALTLAPYCLLMIVLAVSVSSFIIFNIQGKIFLGDGGSYFLGCLLGSLPLVGEEFSMADPWSTTFMYVPLLFFPYIFDTSFTLIKRCKQGKNVLTSHKEHLYQRLHQGGWSHVRVAALYGAMQIFIIFTIISWDSLILYPLWFVILSLFAGWVVKRYPAQG